MTEQPLSPGSNYQIEIVGTRRRSLFLEALIAPKLVWPASLTLVRAQHSQIFASFGEDRKWYQLGQTTSLPKCELLSGAAYTFKLKLKLKLNSCLQFKFELNRALSLSV